MALEICNESLGLWREPSWTKGMPGVYALVVGASAYPFLEGGISAGVESYGLCQLVTSASTAAKVFDWLRRSFHRENLPVVWCWLMLSPTGKEREAFMQEGLSHYSEPTYENLRTAISAWTGFIPKKPKASNISRSFFFFSGHGVQSNRKAVLLPSNYLDTSLGEPDVQKCISVDALKEWMEQSPVAEHIALLDACRNEFLPLTSKGANAYPLFPDNDSSSTGPRAAATLCATSPNSLAYQLEGLPFTFFGQAVLDAFADVEVSHSPTLEFSDFFDYVKRRVNTLLLQKASHSPIEQPVRKSFEGDNDLIVTESDEQSPHQVFIDVDAFHEEHLQTINDTALRYDYSGTQEGFSRRDVLSELTPSAIPKPTKKNVLLPQSRINKALSSRFVDSLEVDDLISFAALTDGSNGEAHRRFGHEYATSPWLNGRAAFYSLQDSQCCLDVATILRVKRNQESSLIQVDLCLQPRQGGVLLVFQDPMFVQRECLAMKLPTDAMESVPIQLTLTVGHFGLNSFPKLQNIEGHLGPCDWNEHYNYLYPLLREADLGSLRKAAEQADIIRIKNAAQQKLRAETAATAGILLFAEAGSIAKVDDWARNLMEWFPLIPDGALLWAQTIREALKRKKAHPYGVAHPIEEMIASLELAYKRGVPFFSESIDMAGSMVRYLRRASLTSNQISRLDVISQWIDTVMAVTVPAGQFLLVTGLPRPDEMAGSGPLTVPEIVALLHGSN